MNKWIKRWISNNAQLTLWWPLSVLHMNIYRNYNENHFPSMLPIDADAKDIYHVPTKLNFTTKC